jgi:hypothetical protein
MSHLGFRLVMDQGKWQARQQQRRPDQAAVPGGQVSG